MLKKLNPLLSILEKPFNFVLLTMVYILIAMLILPGMQRNIEDYAGTQIQILDMQRNYTVMEGVEILDTYTVQGREIYKIAKLSVGLVFPIVYAFLFGTLIFFLLGRAHLEKLKNSNLLFIPFFMMINDWFENACIVGALINYTSKPYTLIQIASFFGVIKWSSFFLILFTILFLLAYNLWRFLRSIKA